MSANPTLPAGWASEDWGGQLVLKAPALVGHVPYAGYVTVDFSRRCFRSGSVTIGPAASQATYTGRGWRQRLIDDAVAWLQGVLGEVS